jgi:hypothetical protein
MANLVVYLQDHLAGARFAVNLLEDLRHQDVDDETANLAARLLPEIHADREVLESLAAELGEDPSTLKEAVAWLAQKASRLKLTMGEPGGIFEAVEVLSLGVLGKLALWHTLEALAATHSAIAALDLTALCGRATSQHAALEDCRRRLAIKAFASSQMQTT